MTRRLAARCGNDPRVRLSEGDRQVVEEFVVYLRGVRKARVESLGGSPVSRVAVRVLLVVGDQAEVVADVAPGTGPDAVAALPPERYPVADVAAQCGVPAADLPGARLTAVVGEGGRLTGFRLV